MKRILFCLLAAIISVAANAQKKTLTIDFSKGSNWQNGFEYASSPVKGKTYEVSDGWSVKFSDGALFRDKTYILGAEGYYGPIFAHYYYGTLYAFFWAFSEKKNTGVTVNNSKGLEATAVRYYVDYRGYEPIFSALDAKGKKVGFTKNEEFLEKTMTSRRYKYEIKLNQPSKSLRFDAGVSDNAKGTGYDDWNTLFPILDIKNKPFHSLAGEEENHKPDPVTGTLYKIEIDYEPAKYPGSYAELLAQYKELEDKYNIADAENSSLKESVENLQQSEDALNATVADLQQQLEKDEADLGETLNDLTSAQMAARRYMALYNINKKDLDKMNSVYTAGVPSSYGNPSSSLRTKNVLKYTETKGQNKELTILNSSSTHDMAGITMGSDGKYYIGSKQGYYITRVEIEYAKIGETDNTSIAGNSQKTKDQSEVWSTQRKVHHATFVANAEMNDNTGDPHVKVRGVNITAAPGEKICIMDIKVWTAESNDRWASEDYSMGTDNFFTYDDFVKYGGGTNAIGAAIQIDDNTKSGTYDLLGRKLAEPQKGINIINGKKVMVK